MTNSAENKKSLGQYFTKHWNKKNVDAGTKPHEKDDEPWAPEYQMIDEPQYVKVVSTCHSYERWLTCAVWYQEGGRGIAQLVVGVDLIQAR